MDIFLLVLKVSGFLFSGIVAILASVLEVKDAEGRVNKKGKFFIAGGVAGIFLAVTTQVVESYMQRQAQKAAAEESLQATKRLEGIMYELNRNLQPLQLFSVAIYRMTSLSRDSDVELYRQRLYDGASEFLKKAQEERAKDQDFSVIDASLVGTLSIREEVAVKPGGRYYPEPSLKAEADSKLMPMCFNFVFFKDPLPASKLKDSAMFGIGVGDAQVRSAFPAGLNMKFDVKKNDLYMDGVLSLGDWENQSGRILSIPDLVGAQMLVATCPRPVPNPPDPNSLRMVSDPFALGGMRLKFGNRSVLIRAGDLTLHRDGEISFWEYRFPETEEALNEKLRGM
ncbi:hypothetical protein M2D07_015525 [Pseudomonas sp. BGr12]|uniref:hypothetical protein n=1 Tax=Pseudomonas sp. BGr12 TaxID=2936269 RepID=UPI00255A09EC|nr:hypothetical protein [Pseudomonas sp. BJa5]MDL2428427.1 hypothetical protein [Pseudomonas sp. BJa5]